MIDEIFGVTLFACLSVLLFVIFSWIIAEVRYRRGNLRYYREIEEAKNYMRARNLK